MVTQKYASYIQVMAFKKISILLLLLILVNFTNCGNINDGSILLGNGYRIYWSGACTSQFYSDSINFDPILRIMGYDYTENYILIFSADSISCSKNIVNIDDGAYYFIQKSPYVISGPMKMEDFRKYLKDRNIPIRIPLKYRNESYRVVEN